MLKDAGFNVAHTALVHDARTPMSAANDAERAECLTQALLETSSDVVMSARGGYGASSLLPLLDWDELRATDAKPLVGFSDISVLHSAMFSMFGRAGLHGPMPGSALYGENNNDVVILQDLLKRRLPWSSSIDVTACNPLQPEASGWLFGGNLATLTSLIGTPWFPSSLHGAIVFLEDIGEHAGRVGRYFSQWCLSGATDGIGAIVLGEFSNAGEGNAGRRDNIVGEFTRRVECPVFESKSFGHISPNYPLAIGASASISDNRLSWHLDSLTPFA